MSTATKAAITLGSALPAGALMGLVWAAAWNDTWGSLSRVTAYAVVILWLFLLDRFVLSRPTTD